MKSGPRKKALGKRGLVKVERWGEPSMSKLACPSGKMMAALGSGSV